MYEVRNDGSAPVRLQSLFGWIWALLYENLPRGEGSGIPDADLSIIRSMVGFIQTGYAEKMTLADIAASGAVGQSKCCSLFLRYLGQTPNAYLTEYRLDKSAYLLRCTDLSVTEVASAAGFGGGSYFAEVFRKWYGKSPTEYRNENSRNE